jgi:heparinase II/III-like protein
MTNARADGEAIATDDRYQALLATSQAIISHRGLSPLFHDLAGQLSRVVHFDFLALAHWQLGNEDEAREWYIQAVEWMEKNSPKDEQLPRIRAEAEKLLKIAEQKPTTRSQSQ